MMFGQFESQGSLRQGFVGRSLCEKGSAVVLFVFMMVPILVFALSVGVELVGIYFRIRGAEQVLESSALLGAAQLPDRGRAARVIQDSLNRRGLKGVQVSVEEGRLSLTLEQHFSGVTTRFFGELLDLEVPLRVEVGLLPLRLALVIDRSSYLAPPLGGRWKGQPSSWVLENSWEDLIVTPRAYAAGAQALVERCYNTIFVALKRSALLLSRYVNDLGVSGDTEVYFLPGYLGERSWNVNMYHLDQRTEDGSEVGYQGTYGRDFWCEKLALWEEMFGGQEKFSFVPPRSGLKSYSDRKWSALRRGIWSRVVYDRDEGSSLVGLEEVVELSLGRSNVGLEARAVTQEVVVLAGDVPRLEGFRFPDGRSELEWKELVRKMADRVMERQLPKLKISYRILVGPTFVVDDIRSRVVRLEDSFDEVVRAHLSERYRSRLSLEVEVSVSPEEFEKRISRLLPRLRSSVVIRKGV